MKLYAARNIRIVAVGVDDPSHSTIFSARLGLPFPLLSDADMAVIKRWQLVNPNNEDLPLHSVFLVGKDGRVIYRKIAGRRPKSPEILMAFDYDRSDWPTTGRLASLKPEPRKSPAELRADNERYWVQSAAAMATVRAPPSGLSPTELTLVKDTVAALRDGRHAPAVTAFRRLANALVERGATQRLADVHAWVLRDGFLTPHPAATRLVDSFADRRPTAARDLIALEGPGWRPFKALFSLQPAFDWIVEHALKRH